MPVGEICFLFLIWLSLGKHEMLLKSLFSYLYLICLQLVGKSAPFQTELWSEPPDAFKQGIIYVIGKKNYIRYSVLLCPCGCGQAIYLHHLKGAKPRWDWQWHWNNTVSFHPSVWLTEGCRSHFFLKKGRVHWVMNRSLAPATRFFKRTI
jgi:hypothetical protein